MIIEVEIHSHHNINDYLLKAIANSNDGAGCELLARDIMPFIRVMDVIYPTLFSDLRIQESPQSVFVSKVIPGGDLLAHDVLIIKFP